MEEIKEKTIVHEQACTKHIIKVANDFSEKTTLLNLSGSLKTSILAGLVDLSGSAKYLESKNTSTSQCSVTMQYHVTTVINKLNVSDLKIQNPEVFKEPEPTHVVVEVLYGANAFMVFNSKAENVSDKDNLQGKIKGMLSSISGEGIGGNLERERELSNECNKKEISCVFYGDFILKNNPFTYEEAVKVYKELPSLLGEKKENAVPVTVWLYPLKRLNDVAAKLTSEISNCVTSEIEKVMSDFHQARLSTVELIEECKSIQAVDIVHKLEQFLTSLNIFTAEFLRKLRELLPAIRGGTVEESALRDLLASLKASGFSKEDMNDWLSGKATEINAVTSFIKEINCDVKHQDTDFESLSTEKVVIVFCFTSLRDEEPYLKKISHSPKVSAPEHTQKTPWYKDPTTTSAKKFFKSRKDGEKLISFIPDTDHPAASVRVYYQKKLKYKNLKHEPTSK